MNKEFFCGTCCFWHHRDDIKATRPPDGLIATVGRSVEERLGTCTGHPPQVIAMPTPVRTARGDELTIAPQCPERIVLESRHGCHLHPDAPLSNVMREYVEKATRAIDAAEEMRKQFEAAREQTEGAMLHRMGVLRTLPEGESS
jgi:hypothetical protein